MESDQLKIPYNITPTYGRVEYTLTVDVDYDNVATVGMNDTLWVELLRPQNPPNQATTVSSTSEPAFGGLSSECTCGVCVHVCVQ